mgnify:FL=1|tara:strand:+ start:1354 stop:1929 length:576 start_codon:yes stop_codon:yes gene_type:complete
MAEKIKQTQFDKVGVNPFSAPTPGESLTTPTDMPKAWERPPQFIDQGNAMEAVYMELTEIDNLRKLIDLIDEGTALDEIAQVVLYKGYSEGKWTPDLMMLLIEPTLYLLISIADYADIKDYTLYTGEETDPDAEIHGDDVEPVDFDADENEDEEIKTDKMAEPKAESLGESLLSRVESELPSKVEQLKGDM